MQSLSWDNYRYILAVHRCETLAGAARLLGVNETTVSRRLTQTESALQSRLFTRRNNGWFATDSGLRLITRIERVKGELDEAEAEVSNSHTRVAGSLRIACEPILLNRMLVPRLNDLLDAHPELTCELISIGESEPLRDADIVIHFAPLQGTSGPVNRAGRSGVLHNLGPLELGVFMARSLERTWDDSQSDSHPAATSGIPWISQVGELAGPTFQVAERATATAPESGIAQRVTVDSPETMLSCVRSGLGRCRLPLGIGLREKQLVQVDTDQSPCFRELVLVSQPELSGSPRLAACTAWVRESLELFNRYS